MSENKKQRVIGSVILLLLIISVLLILNLKSDEMSNSDLLYETTYYFGFGSRNLKIYKNGDVYEDLEIENPNHKPNYKYLKTLTKNEVEDLVERVSNESNNKNIQDYVLKLVYGVNQFDDYGNY